MMKFKEKIRDNNLIIKVKPSFGNPVDKQESEKFINSPMRGFFKMEPVKGNIIEFKGPVSSNLDEYFKMPVTIRNFIFIIIQIITAIETAQKNHFNLNNICLDLSHIYISQFTREVNLIYAPFFKPEVEISLNSFIESVAYSFVPVWEESNNDFQTKFISFIKHNNDLTPRDIRNYLEFLKQPDTDYFKNEYDINSFFRSIKLQNNTNDYSVTTLLNESLNEYSETTLLSVDKNEYINNGELINKRTREVIKLNSDYFRIGKLKKESDYCINYNNAVSRKHAVILFKHGKWFIKDLNSTNHTFINDIKIKEETEVEIFNGDKIRLADENFIFKTRSED